MVDEAMTSNNKKQLATIKEVTNMKKKVLATAVLTAALAFGTAVPAFAESFSNNSADTKVSIFTDTSNICATLPLNLTVGAPANGGAFTGPTDGTYKIVNNSAFDIKVEEVVATQTTDAASKWGLSSDNQATASAPSDGKIATLQMKIATTDDTTGWSVVTNNSFKPATGWTVAAGASNNELAIALSGTMSKASSTAQNSADKAVEAVKLTYKVSAA